MSEAPLLVPPSGGWTVDDLDALPESHTRYELTDGALTVSPSPSGLHQALAARLAVFLDDHAPDPFAVTQAVEIRMARQLTRVPDVLVVHSDEPGRHWFAPAEVVVAVEIESPGSHVEDRATKPALYARSGIPHYWRVELEPARLNVYRLGPGEGYRLVTDGAVVQVEDPFPVRLALPELLPRWARD